MATHGQRTPALGDLLARFGHNQLVMLLAVEERDHHLLSIVLKVNGLSVRQQLSGVLDVIDRDDDAAIQSFHRSPKRYVVGPSCWSIQGLQIGLPRVRRLAALDLNQVDSAGLVFRSRWRQPERLESISLLSDVASNLCTERRSSGLGEFLRIGQAEVVSAHCVMGRHCIEEAAANPAALDGLVPLIRPFGRRS